MTPRLRTQAIGLLALTLPLVACAQAPAPAAPAQPAPAAPIRKAPVKSASATARPVASPARALGQSLARAFGGAAEAPAAKDQDWTEF